MSDSRNSGTARVKHLKYCGSNQDLQVSLAAADKPPQRVRNSRHGGRRALTDSAISEGVPSARADQLLWRTSPIGGLGG